MKRCKQDTILGKISGDFFTFYHNFSSPQVKRNQIIITTKKVYELPHKLPNKLRLRILGNQENSRKSLKCLDLMVSTQSFNQKPNFLVKSRKKSAVKHCTGKPISLNFVSLSAAFCPRLQVINNEATKENYNKRFRLKFYKQEPSRKHEKRFETGELRYSNKNQNVVVLILTHKKRI